MKSTVTLGALLAATLLAPATPVFAQDVSTDYEDEESVIVSGVRVRQGGAQDIGHFRKIAAGETMPRPESLTAEGLMGEHDLMLPAATACAKLFCLVGEAMPASLALRSTDRQFVGLGFASNIDAKTWQRAPLNLVAVVDKSGSMDGEPLDLVRASLLQIVGQMRAGDRIAIVLYGNESHVYLKPTDFAGNRARIETAIRAIESDGATNMEEGLRVGYDTALAEAPGFKGNTRVMLFTDEQPNVGRTDADSFIGMAEEASRHRIGLTTIGVGVQFDATLATKVSSARGGNLFFISDQPSVAATFAKQLDTMVSELAHDLTLTLRPAPGYRIAGVFGVPAEVMEDGPEGAVVITVPSLFFSTQGGGIFATLAKSSDREFLPPARIADGRALLDVKVQWNEAATGLPGNDSLTVAAASAAPSMALRKAHFLVDEYLALREATTVFHRDNDPKAAFALLSGLSARLDGARLDGMEGETRLIGEMQARAGFYAGYGGELPRTLQHLAVLGRWEVTGVQGFDGLARGDHLEFTGDEDMRTYRKADLDIEDETESFEINERQIRLVDSDLVVRYSASGNVMRMYPASYNGAGHITLRRVERISPEPRTR